MALVFVSHSSQDNEKIRPIIDTIKKNNFDSIFLDFDINGGIKVGEEWEKRIYSEIKRSHVMLVAFSPAWIASKWCFAEYRLAKSLGKEIIPIIIEHGEEGEIDKWITNSIQNSDFTKDREVLDRVIDRIRDISICTQKGFIWDGNRSPYPGLVSFEEKDAAIFFGRDRDTKIIIEQLNAMKNNSTSKLLNILSASGLGKSSLLKAGVIPKLKLSYSDRWLVLGVLRPTHRPLYEFSKMIAKLLNKKNNYKEIYQNLRSDKYTYTLDNIFTEIEFLSIEKKSILLPIDQVEEFYSIADEEEKRLFFRVVDYILVQKENIFIIWTLRADFLKEFQIDKSTHTLHRYENIYSLSAISKEDIGSIIKEPAFMAGVNIEEKLVDKIKNDIQTTDALPILALCLNELYNRYAKNGNLRIVDYQHLGESSDSNPMENIIKRKADESIQKYIDNKESLNALKKAFIPHLVRINNQNEYIQKIALVDDLPKESYEILESLVRARLLIKKNVDGETTVEISHEALIRKWSLLQKWLKEEHEFLIGKSQLEISLREWEKSDRDSKALLSGLQLEKSLLWRDKLINRDEIHYIDKSFLHDINIKKRVKHIYIATLTLVSIFLFLSLFNWNKANKYLKKANSTLEDSTIRQAIAYRDYLNQPLKAKLLFARMISQSKNREISTLKVLYNSINKNIKLVAIEEHKASFNGVVESKKSPYHILVWTLSNEIELWDMKKGEKLCSFRHKDMVNGAIFNKNETKILSWSKGGVVKLFDIKRKLIEKNFFHGDVVDGARFSGDESKILSWGDDHKVKVWDINRDDRAINTFKHRYNVNGAIFTKDDNRIFSWSYNTITLWNISKNIKILNFKHNSSVEGAILNQDETKLLSWSKDYTVRLWSVETGEELRLFRHRGMVNGAIFNNKESQILSWADDKSIRLWDIEENRELQIYKHKGSVDGAKFYNNEKEILAWGGEKSTQSGEVKMWNLKTAEKIFSFKHNSVVYRATLNEDNNITKSWSSNWNTKISELRVWHIEREKNEDIENIEFTNQRDRDKNLIWKNQKEIKVYDKKNHNFLYSLKHYGGVNGAIFNKSQEKILSWSQDTTVKLWSKESQEPLLILKHDLAVNGAFFNRDETMILSWSSHNIRLWDMRGNMLISIKRDNIKDIAFNKKETKIVSIDTDNHIEVYNLYKDRVLKNQDYMLEAEIQNGVYLKKSGEIEVLDANSWLKKRELYKRIKEKR